MSYRDIERRCERAQQQMAELVLQTITKLAANKAAAILANLDSCAAFLPNPDANLRRAALIGISCYWHAPADGKVAEFVKKLGERRPEPRCAT